MVLLFKLARRVHLAASPNLLTGTDVWESRPLNASGTAFEFFAVRRELDDLPVGLLAALSVRAAHLRRWLGGCRREFGFQFCDLVLRLLQIDAILLRLARQ